MEEMKQYSDYVLEEDNLRSALAVEENNAKMEKRKEIDRKNLQKAEEVRNNRKNDKMQEKKEKLEEVMNAISDPFLSEETDFSYKASNKDGCRFRPDHFKGFSKDQIKYIFVENSAVVAEKRKLESHAEEERKDWDNFQATVVDEMERAEHDRQLRVQHDNQIQAETLKIQTRELKLKQAQMRKDKFGAIEEGFFQKFGQSCR